MAATNLNFMNGLTENPINFNLYSFCTSSIAKAIK